MMIDTSKKPVPTGVKPTKTPMTDEEYQKSKCRHGPNQKCVNCLGVTKENAETAALKHLCQHPPGGKCPNCMKADQTVFKHESFDNWIVEQRKKCEKSHPSNAKCQNCTFVQNVSYKVDYNCKNHKPYPLGMCNKCVPPAVVLNR